MISAIIVNYHTSELIKKTICSLQAQKVPLEIIVIDNSQSDFELAELKKIKNITVKSKNLNLGFAKACNFGLTCATGDYILLLNPDAYLFPEALGYLFDFLINTPKAAAVGPQVFWDAEKKFLLPPNPLPTPFSYLKNRTAQFFPSFMEQLSYQFRDYSYNVWTAKSPYQVNALSGGHLLIKRKAIENAGGLFDERFFMYWEDSDLMYRLQQKKWQLWLIPQSHALHAYEHTPQKNQLMLQNWPSFYQKHIQSRPFYHIASKIYNHLPTHPIKTLFSPLKLTTEGLSASIPPHLNEKKWLLEMSPAANFISSIGHFGCGNKWHIPYNLISRFREGQYFLRLGTADKTRQSPDWQYWCWQHPEN